MLSSYVGSTVVSRKHPQDCAVIAVAEELQQSVMCICFLHIRWSERDQTCEAIRSSTIESGVGELQQLAIVGNFL